MNAKNLRIVFMGTPEFAVPSLKALVEQGYNVVGVVTTPDRQAGRGQKIPPFHFGHILTSGRGGRPSYPF